MDYVSVKLLLIKNFLPKESGGGEEISHPARATHIDHPRILMKH